MATVNSTLTPSLSLEGRGGVIVVEDRLDGVCVRHVHLLANEEIGLEALRPYGLMMAHVTVERGRDAGTHFLRAVGPCRTVWEVDAACVEGKRRRLVVWSLEGYGSVREAMRGAACDFERLFGFAPKYAYVRRLPRGAENCMEVEGLILLEAEWMLERAVAVGGWRTPPLAPPQIQRANLGRGE